MNEHITDILKGKIISLNSGRTKLENKNDLQAATGVIQDFLDHKCIDCGFNGHSADACWLERMVKNYLKNKNNPAEKRLSLERTQLAA